MLIGVDICNTIANINYELLQKFNISPKQYPAPEVPRDFFTSPEGLKLFMNARPYYSAQKVLLKIITGGYRIVYMTSRPKVAEFVTRRWLKLNGFPLGNVEFIPSSEKAAMAQDSGMVAFFDDDPVVIQDLIQKKITTFVKVTPYNSHLVGPHVVRFKDWGRVPFLTVFQGQRNS